MRGRCGHKDWDGLIKSSRTLRVQHSLRGSLGAKEMIWMWLAIIASFAWNFYAGYGNENELLKLLRAHSALLDRVHSLSEEMRSRFTQMDGEIQTIKKRLGYEELDHSLGEAIIWGENRERALKSIFPRVTNLEFLIGLLDDEVKTVFEINDLKDWDSLTPEETRMLPKRWPRHGNL